MRKGPALTAHSRGIRHNPPADAMPAPIKRNIPRASQGGTMQQVGLWEITADRKLPEIPAMYASLEEWIEDWLADDISVLDPNLLVISRQVRTSFGGTVGQSVPYCELVSAVGAALRACSVPRNQHVVGIPAGAAMHPRGLRRRPRPSPWSPRSSPGLAPGGDAGARRRCGPRRRRA